MIPVWLLLGCAGVAPEAPPVEAVADAAAPSIDALVMALRGDPFDDPDHGNHSATMKALEVAGEPALPALAAALTDEVAGSSDPADAALAASIVMIMARVDVVAAAPHAVRVARLSPDRQAAIRALQTVLGHGVWTSRLFLGDPMGLPFPLPEPTPDLTPALAAHQESLRATATSAPDGYTQLLAAQVLARYGTGEPRTFGERRLLAVLADPGTPWRGDVADAVGLLGVQSARDALAAVDDPALLARAAWALHRLSDPRYVSVAVRAMQAEDPWVRREAIALAAHSRDVAFVAALIGRLGDTGPNGSESTATVEGRTVTTVHVLGEDAAEALEQLTFARHGRDPAAWSVAHAASGDATWEDLLRARVDADLAALGAARSWEANRIVERYAHADHPAILPLLSAYLAAPDLDASSTDEDSFRSGGGPPVAIDLLYRLALPGDVDARAQLVGAMDSRDPEVRRSATAAVAAFDLDRATARFAADLAGPDCALWSATHLTQLGDERGLPELVACLSDPSSSVASLAAGSLRRGTRVDLPFDADAELALRHQQAAAWDRWWAEAGPGFALDLRAVRIDAESYR
jgi:HEAT repeat protein